MKPIRFTQFLRPNGTQQPTTIARPEPIAQMAEELLAAGCRLEIEVLTTGEISITVEGAAATWAIEIVENGPGVPEAVDKVICDAHRILRTRKPEFKLHRIGEAFQE